MRFLVLYLRSRHVPAALLAAGGSVAVLWWLSQVFREVPGVAFGVFAAVAGAAATGPGLAGADLDLDRTARVAWPPRRAAHITVAGIVVAGIVAATALTGMQLIPAARVIRDVIGMSGLIAFGAVVIGAGRAWILPLTWTLLAMQRPPSPTPTYRAVLTWMLQSPATPAASVTALILGAAGVLAYAILGPRS
jgi:hypothetical protein